MKTYRFDGKVTCDVTLWIEAETQGEAEGKLAAAPAADLSNATSLNHIRPDKATIAITSIRESTGENP